MKSHSKIKKNLTLLSSIFILMFVSSCCNGQHLESGKIADWLVNNKGYKAVDMLKIERKEIVCVYVLCDSLCDDIDETMSLFTKTKLVPVGSSWKDLGVSKNQKYLSFSLKEIKKDSILIRMGYLEFFDYGTSLAGIQYYTIPVSEL